MRLNVALAFLALACGASASPYGGVYAPASNAAATDVATATYAADYTPTTRAVAQPTQKQYAGSVTKETAYAHHPSPKPYVGDDHHQQGQQGQQGWQQDGNDSWKPDGGNTGDSNTGDDNNNGGDGDVATADAALATGTATPYTAAAVASVTAVASKGYADMSAPTFAPVDTSVNNQAMNAQSQTGTASNSSNGPQVGAIVGSIGGCVLVAAMVALGLVMRNRRRNSMEEPNDAVNPYTKPEQPLSTYTPSSHARVITPQRTTPPTPQLPSLSRMSTISMSRFTNMYSDAPPVPAWGRVMAPPSLTTPTPLSVTPPRNALSPEKYSYDQYEDSYRDINMEAMDDHEEYENVDVGYAHDNAYDHGYNHGYDSGVPANHHDSLMTVDSVDVAPPAPQAMTVVTTTVEAVPAAVATATAVAVSGAPSTLADLGRFSMYQTEEDDDACTEANRDSVYTVETFRDSMYTDNYRDSMMTTDDGEFGNDVLAAHFANGDNVQSSILAALNHMGANVEAEGGPGAGGVGQRISVAASSEYEEDKH